MNKPEILRSARLQAASMPHGFLTRRGGVSEGPFRSLNCGYGSGDAPDRVAENRRRAIVAAGLEGCTLITPVQVHGHQVAVADSHRTEPPEADAIITHQPDLVIGILTADCAPVLVADPTARIVGAAHAGWRGALEGVIEATVAGMERLGARRSRMIAAIGPTIAQASYQVDPEFAAPFLRDDPAHQSLFRRAGTKLLFDLPGYAARRLAEAGIGRVDRLGHDTAAEPGRFFSYRRNLRAGERRYGRLLAVVGIG